MRIIILVLFLFVFSSPQIFGQEASIDTALQNLKASIRNVETQKETYEQFLEKEKGASDKIMVTIQEKDKKGRIKEIKYEFYWSDIAKNTVRRETKGDVIYVVFKAQNQQPLISFFEEKELKAYKSEGLIYAEDADNAKEIVALLKQGIEISEKTPIPGSPPEKLSDLLTWLKENVKEVLINEDSYEQQLLPAESLMTQMKYSRTIGNSKGQKAEAFNFNLVDFDQKKVAFDVKGTKLFVSLETTRKLKLIQYFEEGQLKAYTNSFDIYLEDIRQARYVSDAFQKAIKLSQDTLPSLLPDVADLPAALGILETEVKAVQFDENTFEQELKINKTTCLADYTIVTKNGEQQRYVFNLRDFNPKTIDYSLSGKFGLGISLGTMQNNKFIEVYENGEIDAYERNLELLATDVENARLLMAALQSAIPQCEAIPIEAKDLTWLFEHFPSVTIGEDSYEQKLMQEGENPCNLQLARTESDDKKSTEYLYEFLLTDLNAKTIKLVLSGKKVLIEIKTRNNEKLVKIIEEGEPDDYENELLFIVPDIETGKLMIETWKAVIEGCN